MKAVKTLQRHSNIDTNSCEGHSTTEDNLMRNATDTIEDDNRGGGDAG